MNLFEALSLWLWEKLKWSVENQISLIWSAFILAIVVTLMRRDNEDFLCASFQLTSVKPRHPPKTKLLPLSRSSRFLSLSSWFPRRLLNSAQLNSFQLSPFCLALMQNDFPPPTTPQTTDLCCGIKSHSIGDGELRAAASSDRLELPYGSSGRERVCWILKLTEQRELVSDLARRARFPSLTPGWCFCPRFRRTNLNLSGSPPCQRYKFSSWLLIIPPGLSPRAAAPSRLCSLQLWAKKILNLKIKKSFSCSVFNQPKHSSCLSVCHPLPFPHFHTSEPPFPQLHHSQNRPLSSCRRLHGVPLFPGGVRKTTGLLSCVLNVTEVIKGWSHWAAEEI